MILRKGLIVLLSLDPVKGSEIAKTRIVKILGEISSTTMKQIENAIMIHLDIR